MQYWQPGRRPDPADAATLSPDDVTNVIDDVVLGISRRPASRLWWFGHEQKRAHRFTITYQGLAAALHAVAEGRVRGTDGVTRVRAWIPYRARADKRFWDLDEALVNLDEEDVDREAPELCRRALCQMADYSLCTHAPQPRPSWMAAASAMVPAEPPKWALRNTPSWGQRHPYLTAMAGVFIFLGLVFAFIYVLR